MVRKMSKKQKIMSEIINTAQKYNLRRDDLIIEADVIEEFDECLYTSLYKFTPDDLREAAKLIAV